MEQGMFISIHPEYCTLLSEGKKVHKFRSVKPKRQTDFLWIYESAPIICPHLHSQDRYTR
ncbi:hypothetical protein [Rossellomorea marisflavi]|uniref:hypothetical protein n=1 Tax=Rossellomorea marisflavi TaxID=189381 RepID=UPI003459F841